MKKMLSKSQIKLIRSLQLKKYRETEGLFIAEGKKIVEELMGSPIHIKQILISKSRPELVSGSHKLKHDKLVDVVEIPQEEFGKISTLTTPSGILAVCNIPKANAEQPDLKKDIVLALDDIRDPGNLGTIIRIADWFDIKHIYCSEESVDAYNPKVVQASMGSIARVHVHYINLASMLQKKVEEGIQVFGAMMNGKNIYTEQVKPKGILVIGNESNGISKEVQKHINHPVCIPSYNTKGPESLNAAIATAILCAEFRR